METSQLQTFLAEADAPCPSCGYNLRGLKSDVCPECNQPLMLTVGLAVPRQRALMAAVIGLATGTGFQGLMAVFFLFIVSKRGGPPDWPRFVAITSGFFLVEVAALGVLIHRRRQLLRASDSAKGWVVVLAWTMTLAGFVVFTSLTH